MLRSYSDITTKLGQPVWWDDQGVPRYEAFRPEMCGVYDRAVALLLIGCAACGKQFMVSLSRTSLDDAARMVEGKPHWPAPTQETVGEYWSYGDPPIHGGCGGETMSSNEIAVIAYFEQRAGGWERLREHELVVMDL